MVTKYGNDVIFTKQWFLDPNPIIVCRSLCVDFKHINNIKASVDAPIVVLPLKVYIVLLNFDIAHKRYKSERNQRTANGFHVSQGYPLFLLRIRMCNFTRRVHVWDYSSENRISTKNKFFSRWVHCTHQ
jgi:hypothetical protein